MSNALGPVGPFDFLFCKRCNKHIDRPPVLQQDMDFGTLTAEDRRNRVAPNVNIKLTPTCPDCRGPLVQKYISVIVNIPGDAP